jgi:recombination protein RecT
MTKALTTNPMETLRGALAKAHGSFRDALPTTVAAVLTPERLTKITLGAISRVPRLLECTPQSILRSVLDAASLGLEPSGGALGQAYLVPFKNNKIGKYEAQLIVGYRGLITLARRSGHVSGVEAHVVHENDVFIVEYGLNPVLVHKPKITGDRGKIIAVHCLALLSDGARQVEVMTIGDVEDVRKRSRASNNGPWVTDYSEMVRKTVVRRAAKYWPLSIEIARAFDLDDVAAEARGAPFANEADVIDVTTEPTEGKHLAREPRKLAEPPPSDAQEPPPEQPAAAKPEKPQKGTKPKAAKKAKKKPEHPKEDPPDTIETPGGLQYHRVKDEEPPCDPDTGDEMSEAGAKLLAEARAAKSAGERIAILGRASHLPDAEKEAVKVELAAGQGREDAAGNAAAAAGRAGF